MLQTTYKWARRLVIAVIGATVVILGIIISVPGIPGWGLPIIVLGLAILAGLTVWVLKRVVPAVRGR